MKTQQLTLEDVTRWVRTQTDLAVLDELTINVINPHSKYLHELRAKELFAKIKPGNVVLVRWKEGAGGDNGLYPMVVVKSNGRSNQKTVRCAYVYEGGTVEYFNIGYLDIFSVYDDSLNSTTRPRYIANMTEYWMAQLSPPQQKYLVAPEDVKFFLNTIEAAQK